MTVMVKNISSTLNAKQTRTGEDPRNQRPIKPRIYANNDAISVDRDPVHVYKMYNHPC